MAPRGGSGKPERTPSHEDFSSVKAPFGYDQDMPPAAGEFIGTALLVLLGNGVVAGALLTGSKSHGAGWMAITAGWASGVFVAVFCVAGTSGAHINPAITIAFASLGIFPWESVPSYIVAQLAGAFTGAAFVWLAYWAHWSRTEEAELKRAAFCTSPAVRCYPANFLTEAIGTFVLVFGVLAMKTASAGPLNGSVVPVDLGALGALPVALLVWGIGLSLGGPTGYAINPARDLGPRIAYTLLPVAGKGPADWTYAWVPVFGPVVGGLLAAGAYAALGRF